MPRGGKRDGAGRKKGTRDPETLQREQVQAAIRQRVLKSADRILNAQLGIAEGCSYLYRVEKAKEKGEKRKHVLVTSPSEIRQYLDGELKTDDFYYISTDKPNNDAIKDLWDRTLGKPTQGVEVSGPNGEPVRINHHYAPQPPA